MLFLKKICILKTLLLILPFSIFCTTQEEAKEIKSNRYVVGINNKQKFVWFRVAKVASTTVKRVFMKHDIAMPIKSLEFKFNPSDYQNYFKFAFVRNPWSRVVSCYAQKVENKNPDWAFYYSECFDKGFEYFVDFIDRKNLTKADRHIRLQTSLIPVTEVDFIGRLENFDEDFLYVLKKLGVKDAHIPQKNPSNHLHYSQYYNDRTKEIIAQKYAKDIEVFGYEFEYQ